MGNMRYLQPSFTLPCSDHINQEEWDKIWSNFYEVGKSGKLVQPLKKSDWFKENNDGA
jgi:hypothetical protein